MMLRAAISLISVLMVWTPVQASAQLFEAVRLGILAQSCCGQGQDKEEGVGINGEFVLKSPDFLEWALSPRPIIGATVATDGDATTSFYAGLDWQFEPSPKFFVSGGVGGAIHTGETHYDPIADAPRMNDTLFLGCRALFRLHANIGYRVGERSDLMLSWSHLSNAGLCDVNEGLDHLGIRFGYRL